MADVTGRRLYLARFTEPRETSPMPQRPFSSRHVLRGRAEAGERPDGDVGRRRCAAGAVDDPREEFDIGATALAVSAVATAAGLGVLVVSSRAHVSTLAVALAGVTLLASAARTQLAFRLLARMADPAQPGQHHRRADGVGEPAGFVCRGAFA